MYFIEKSEDLKGKEILYVNTAPFAEAILIITKDKGIFVVAQNENDDVGDKIIEVYNKQRAKRYIMGFQWLRNYLHGQGVLTDQEIEEYEKEQEILRVKQKEEEMKRQREHERMEYERLKDKFECYEKMKKYIK